MGLLAAGGVQTTPVIPAKLESLYFPRLSQLMAVLVDDDPASSDNISGLIGLQIENLPCKVSFRNLWIRKLN